MALPPKAQVAGERGTGVCAGAPDVGKSGDRDLPCGAEPWHEIPTLMLRGDSFDGFIPALHRLLCRSAFALREQQRRWCPVVTQWCTDKVESYIDNRCDIAPATNECGVDRLITESAAAAERNSVRTEAKGDSTGH